MKRPKLYQSTPARRFLVGTEPTVNPNPAAQYLLGPKVVRSAARHPLYARRKIGRSRHNPAPAFIAALAKGGLGKLIGSLFGKKVKPPDQRYADLKAATAPGVNPATRAAWIGSMQGWAARGDPVSALVLQELGIKQAGVPAAVAADPKALSEWQALLGSPVAQAAATTATRQLIAAAKPKKGRAPRAPRQVVRYDPDTGDKYRVSSDSAEAASWPSRKPSARTLAGVGGGAAAAAPLAGKAAGLAGASGAAVAGVVIGGLAVGVLIGTGLRKLFGTARAVRAEEAAVQGALALRNTRTQLESQLGRKLNTTEARALFSEYVTQLQKLGFVQDAAGMWHRPRSALERFLG